MGSSNLLKSEGFTRDDIFHRYNCLVVDLTHSRQNLVSVRFRERSTIANGTDEYEAIVEPVDGAMENFEDLEKSIYEEDDDEDGESSGENGGGGVENELKMKDQIVQIEMVGLNEQTELIRINGSFGLRCSLLLPGGM